MIHLTVYSNNITVRLNPRHIVAYFTHQAGTCVVVRGEDNFVVRETPEEIDELLEDK